MDVKFKTVVLRFLVNRSPWGPGRNLQKWEIHSFIFLPSEASRRRVKVQQPGVLLHVSDSTPLHQRVHIYLLTLTQSVCLCHSDFTDSNTQPGKSKTWQWKEMMTGAMRKKMICLCDLCKCSAFSPLKYIFISKHSVVCIHLRQLWIPSQPLTTELNEKRHLKGNTKGAQLKQLSAALSVFYLEYNLLKIYGFFHRSHFSPLGTKWSDWPQKQREQLFLLHI